MGYLGRRIGLSQDKGDSTPGGADGAVGGGLLDLFASGYFQRQGKTFNAPGAPTSGHTATGGVISDYTSGSNVYRAHIFTSSGTFDVETVGDFGATVEYLVVAGGGASGFSAYSGGGGGGGFSTNVPGHPLASPAAFPVSTSPGSYTVTIGAGGGGNPGYGTNYLGNSGSPSSLVSPNSPETITSNGGGRGGAYNAADDGAPCGSGGGGAANGGNPGYGYNTSTLAPVLAAVPLPSPYGLNQGSDGGGGNGLGGGGGGGAGGAGGASTDPITGGVAGAGSPISISGSDVTYAAGGGGKTSAPQDGTAGAQSSGNGGTANGATGGSGIVIVRYKIATLQTDTAKATGGEISFYNNKTIHTFRSSGTFATEPNWSAAEVEYVVIGGGGSGGAQIYLSGAGGAGAYRTGSTPIGAHPVSTSIQVGAGGAPMGAGPFVTPPAANGTPSYFGTPITAPGGGGGGTYPSGAGLSGGSGGGGAGAGSPAAGGNATGDPFPGTIGATPTNGWGHDGGVGTSSANYGSGGGGGAGDAASGGSPTIGGRGGAGIQLPATFRDPSSTVGAPGPTSAPTPNGFDTSGKYWVAGGGGGSQYLTGGSPSPGGGPGGPYAGGGAGGAGGAGGDGGVNTGGGAGGQERAQNTPAEQAGRGGSGLVLIAYPT